MRYLYLQSFMLISLIVLELCHGPNSKCKNNKEQLFQNQARQSYVFVHCTFTQWDLSSYKFSCWYLLLFQSYVLDKNSKQTDKATTMGGYPKNSIISYISYNLPMRPHVFITSTDFLKGLHWGFLTWWDWKIFFPDKCTIWCRFRPLIFVQNFRSFQIKFFQNNYSNCKKMTENEKHLNAFHSNRARKSIKIRFSIYFKVH
jgi:hypothetical protein